MDSLQVYLVSFKGFLIIKKKKKYNWRLYATRLLQMWAFFGLFLESFPFLSPGSSWCVGLCRATVYGHEVQRPPAEGTRFGTRCWNSELTSCSPRTPPSPVLWVQLAQPQGRTPFCNLLKGTLSHTNAVATTLSILGPFQLMFDSRSLFA